MLNTHLEAYWAAMQTPEDDKALIELGDNGIRGVSRGFKKSHLTEFRPRHGQEGWLVEVEEQAYKLINLGRDCPDIGSPKG